MEPLSNGATTSAAPSGRLRRDHTITVGTPGLLRAINERTVLESVRRVGPVSRAQIARETALSIHLRFWRNAPVPAGIAIAASLFATAIQAGPKPDIGHFTLANGLGVVVVPDRRAPVVTHMVWYKVGAADETPG